MVVLELLAVAGALQGLLILLLIACRFRHVKNVALALLLLVFSIRLGTIPSWNAATLLAHPWLWPATTPLPFLFGPLLWWYARELGRDAPALPPFLPIHFLPYAAETVAIAATVGGMETESYGRFVASVFAGDPPLWLPVRNGLKIAVNVAYIALSARIAFGGDARRLPPARRHWLRVLVLIPAGVLAAFGFVAVNPAATARLAAGVATPFAVLAAAMAILIYAFSFLVLIAPSGLDRGGVPLASAAAPAVSDEECRRLADRALRALDAGAFQEPELTVASLAALLGVRPNRLSVAINRCFRASFRTVLNRRRLDFFAERAARGALARQTVLDLALEAGFPSKSTFNRVFKKEFGLAPTAYAENLRREAAEPGPGTGGPGRA
jgi:AraC-like DNA-binding protein